MSETDDLVNRWFLGEWVNGTTAYMTPGYDRNIHGPVSDLEVISFDADWECGCYSSWTRDDQEVITSKVKTKSGVVRIRHWTYGDMPELIERLVDFGRLEDTCSVERRLNDD